MKKKSVSKIVYIICFVVIILLCVGLVVRFYNSDNTIIDNIVNLTNNKYTSFDVSHDEVKFTDTNSNNVFVVGEELRFGVNYQYGLLATNKNYNYSVKIVPAEGTNFDFTVDGVLFGYSQETDLASAFNVEKFDKYFIMSIPTSVLDVLESIYPASTVLVPELDDTLDYYTLIVTAHDNTTLVSISFKSGSLITGVVLDNATLVF